jgi:hypothetical protein
MGKIEYVTGIAGGIIVQASFTLQNFASNF